MKLGLQYAVVVTSAMKGSLAKKGEILQVGRTKKELAEYKKPEGVWTKITKIQISEV